MSETTELFEITTVTPRPCRWTISCPTKECAGYVRAQNGNASWKRGDFTSEVTTGLCDKCNTPTDVAKPS